MEVDSGGSRQDARISGRKWRGTKQPAHNRLARCQHCQHAFEVGELRLSGVRAIAHPRYWHVGCLAEPLSSEDASVVVEELGDEAHAIIEPHVVTDDTPAGVLADPVLRAGQVAHATSLQVVCTTCPAHHSDQRYAPALCLGALRRLTEEGDAQQAPYVRLVTERLARVREGWEAMAVEAASENPEPWLPAGVSGVEWQ